MQAYVLGSAATKFIHYEFCMKDYKQCTGIHYHNFSGCYIIYQYNNITYVHLSMYWYYLTYKKICKPTTNLNIIVNV